MHIQTFNDRHWCGPGQCPLKLLYGDTATETVLEPTFVENKDMSVISVNTDMIVSFVFLHVQNFYLPNKLLSKFIEFIKWYETTKYSI